MEIMNMLFLSSTDPASEKTELLVIPVCEDKNLNDSPVIASTVQRVRGFSEFTGAKGDETILYDPSQVKARRIMFIGLGKTDSVSLESFRAMAGQAISQGMNRKLTAISLLVPTGDGIGPEMADILKAMMEGACLKNYLFDQYRTQKRPKPLRRINFLVKPEAARINKRLPSRILAVCQGTLLSRDWVNIPSNDKRPTAFARKIVRLAKKEGLKTVVLGKKELKQKKFGAILAVAEGSNSSPCMVIVDYHPRGAKTTVALVGKGVTFDSGGLNLKTTKTINMMKVDMAGAAAVAATVLAAARLKLKQRVIGILPLVENMISGKATRPGDIIRSYSGKTIEIGNTDAEGRLILIDALHYAVQRYKPGIVIDMATLTGACVMALGEGYAGVFSNDDELASAITQSGEETSERCWRMPLPEDYKDLIKSEVADINNLPSSRWGGAITAALFLSEFVGQTRWAHIDIAGPAYRKKGNDYCTPGGTGFGVRLLCDFLSKIQK
jgi:leucyl aminopeptidase